MANLDCPYRNTDIEGLMAELSNAKNTISELRAEFDKSKILIAVWVNSRFSFEEHFYVSHKDINITLDEIYTTIGRVKRDFCLERVQGGY